MSKMTLEQEEVRTDQDFHILPALYYSLQSVQYRYSSMQDDLQY